MIFVLKLLPPEIAHYLTIKFFKFGLVRFFYGSYKSDNILRQIIWNLEFHNPIGLAAGFDKNAEIIDPILNLGFGFVEVGTITPISQFGNSQPRIFRLSKDQAIINHLGFNNQGAKKIKSRLQKRYEKKHFSNGIIGINIGKNEKSKLTSEDYLTCIETLGFYADYIAINISSPNTPGLRNLQNREYLENLIIDIKNKKKMNEYIKEKPLLIKISPDINQEQKRDIALTCLAQSIDGIIISNTTLSRPNSLLSSYKDEVGGLSGKPIFINSTLLIKEMYSLTGGKITLIGVGGIFSGRDAYEKIKAGASIVQLYTSLIYEGPSVIDKINKELVYYLKADGYANISEAIGSESLI